MSPYLAEFIGTTILIIFGNGVVANVVLARTKGQNSGWIVIRRAGDWLYLLVCFVHKPLAAHI